MGQINKLSAMPVLRTHEGGKADRISDEQQLRRSVLSCFLFEDEAYEDGLPIAKRIEEFALKSPLQIVANLAIEARQKHNLRSVPLLLTSILADMGKGTSVVKETIEQVIQRPDEMGELLAIHCLRHNVTPDKVKTCMSHGMRRGIANSFKKFSEYSLAKYDNPNKAVKLKDVLFLTHPKPKDKDQEAVWGRLIKGELATPDTWEVELSAGKDKKETFERLIREGKLGYLALLRNLRNMVQAGCDPKIVSEAILARKGGAEKVLPFRFIAAARHAPQYEPYLDQSLEKCISELPRLSGTTAVLVDISGSMDHKLSAKSDLTRADAAAALASVINGDRRVFSFSDVTIEVPPRHGMAGVDAILKSQHHRSTELFEAVDTVNQYCKYDRIIVITDEQANGHHYGNSKRLDRLPNPKGLGYMINVASARNGVSYTDSWTHLDGFSENIIKFIIEKEQF